MSRPAAVVFDCDGVLVDSEVVAVEVEVAALGAAGLPLTPEELAERYVGVSVATQARMVAEEFGVALDGAWWDALAADVEAALAARVRPIQGIRDVVEGLDRPYALASSSRRTRIEVCLRSAGLHDLFPVALRSSAEEVARGKPAPDLFLLAARRLGVDPTACVVVEDSPYGVEGALAAGMAVIGFTGGAHAGGRWADRLRAAGAAQVVADARALAAVLPRRPDGS
jgi:HAD superfamily hydrolase (TIGR01509 family)